MPSPVLLGIPLLITAVSSFFVGIFTWFVQFFTVRISIVLAAIVLIGAFTTTFLLAINALIDGLSVSLPREFSTAVSYVVPSNCSACIAAIVAAHLLRFLYSWQVKILQYKLM